MRSNRSICDPATPCACGGRAIGTRGYGGCTCSCLSCGAQTDGTHQTVEAACDAWDRGDRITEAEYMRRHLPHRDFVIWQRRNEEESC